MITLKTTKFDLYPRRPGEYGLVVYKPRLAQKVNKLLNRYEPGAITNSCQPLFIFSREQIWAVLAVLRVRGIAEDRV